MKVVSPSYSIKVTNGTASKAEAKAGETITITADVPPVGKEFDKWVVTGATVDDATKAITTFKMSASNVTATATYKDSFYSITAINCTVSIDKPMVAVGESITIVADQIDGKAFSHWKISGATVEDASARETTFTMSKSDVVVEAVYEDCDCNCHKDGIVGFFYKIILFFQKLFGKNLVCEACGAKH